jgi:hypothetical protein
VPLSAIDSISPAFHHAKQQLFQPFRFGQWSRLALVGLCAGEMSSGGGCNFQIPQTNTGAHRELGFAAFPNSPVFGLFIAVLLITLPILWLIFLYISSRMRFVLFDSVIARRCEIGRMWRARQEPAFKYFIWQIIFSLVSLAGIAVFVGIPVLAAFLLGWFSAPREHLAGLILAGFFVFLVFFAWIVLLLVVHVFTKDFVVPQMALEDLSAFDGWRRLLTMLRSEKGGYAIYTGMKVGLTMGAAFAVAILAIIVIVILLIPFGGFGAITVLLGKSAGLTWNVFTITAAVVAGCVFLVVLLYAVSLVSVPVIVFFPAYAIYFFAARYPLLANLIYPPPPPLPPTPPTPPITPTPEPAV